MSTSNASPSKAVSATAKVARTDEGASVSSSTIGSTLGPPSQLSKEAARYAKQLKALSGSTFRGRGGSSSQTSRFSASGSAVRSASPLLLGQSGVETSSSRDNKNTDSNHTSTTSSHLTPSISPTGSIVSSTSSSSSTYSRGTSNKALFLASLTSAVSKSVLGKRSISVSGITPTSSAASPFLALTPPSPIPQLGPKTPLVTKTATPVSSSKSGAQLPSSKSSAQPLSSSPPRNQTKQQVSGAGPPKSMAEQAASSLMRTMSSGGLTTKLEVVTNDWVSKGSSPKKPRKVYSKCDRFIPNRTTDTMANVQAKLDLARRPSFGAAELTDEASIAYSHQIAEACGINLESRMLAFSAEPPTLEGRDSTTMRKLYSRHPSFTRSSSNLVLKKRTILTSPEKVLDAPGLRDDYYLNLLDWSCSNMIAIGLGKSVFLWDAESGHAECLMTLTDNTDDIASVSWAYDGHFLAVGTFDGDTQIWDVETKAKVRSMTGHVGRVGVLAWDKHILSSGCRDGSIWNHDVRVQNHKIAELVGHTNEVCGMAWRSDGQQLASGGNDNLVNIWDARTTVPKYTKTNHTAAVKAVAWCPWQTNLLATGGGTYDKHIHFWNSSTGTKVNSLHTGSQVTSIVFSTEYREFMSSHGYPDHNIVVYGYPSMTKVANILAHDSRILHTAMSPDGQVVATVSSDENLKFWKLFEKRSNKEVKGSRRLTKSGSFGGFGGRGHSYGHDDDDGGGISGGVNGTTIRGKTISSMTTIR